MVTQNLTMYASKILFELIWDVLYFPLWWYTRGLADFIRSESRFISRKNKNISFSIWVRNWLKPMYGQYDLAGIVISLIVRTFQIIFRGALMVIWLIICLIGLALWLILPIFVILEIYLQIN